MSSFIGGYDLESCTLPPAYADTFDLHGKPQPRSSRKERALSRKLKDILGSIKARCTRRRRNSTTGRSDSGVEEKSCRQQSEDLVAIHRGRAMGRDTKLSWYPGDDGAVSMAVREGYEAWWTLYGEDGSY
ncbi:hypothetical protein LTR56_011131 [Elasticomyces elasticus]|nr:hypothetical protein LTR56_011131 [Elasticomyces elasticus]KAK3662449.1 hypothetical protein LTR22_006728 [Elasticomyces elasticus]KAK4926438.1 hypothetical protein LTR49_006645 [Elasticomyces elasticus]KAK5761189.1 hypothetical protein LTS12_008670 [Elasticomyces elasticus]